MTCTLQVVFDQQLAEYDFKAGHPMAPIRVQLTMELARAFRVLSRPGVTVVPVRAASDAELELVHDARLPRRCAPGRGTRCAPSKYGRPAPPGADPPALLGHGLGTADQIRSSPGCTRHPPWSPAPRWPRPVLSGPAQRSTGRTSPAACITPCAPVPAASASTTTPRSPSPGCWTRAPGRSPTSTSTLIMATASRPRSGPIRACSRSACMRIRQPCSPAPAGRRETGGAGAEGLAVNVALPAGTEDAGWLRALHAIVPPLLREFGPQILVSQHGCDTHYSDPLANLADQHRRAAISARAAASARARDGRRPVGADRRRWLSAGPGRAPHLDPLARRGNGRPA